MNDAYLYSGVLDDITRKELWKIELSILDNFKQILHRHNLNYFLIGGAAIGAVRHKGFIPWDDDLDIGMLRKDFEEFLKYAEEELDPSYSIEYGFSHEDTEFNPFCRIRDRKSSGIINSELGHKGVHGIFIEIYPFDNVPTSRFLRKVQWTLSQTLLKLISKKVYGEKLCGKKEYISKAICLVSKKQLFLCWNRVCQFFNIWNARMVDTVSLPAYSPSEVDFFFKEDILKTIDMPFENTVVSLPVGYDRCLRKCYGDYMQLPPVEQRELHHRGEVFYDPYKAYTYYEQPENRKILDVYFGEVQDEKYN